MLTPPAEAIPVQTASGDRYAVSSGCTEASLAAISCLESGGNVVDAAIAASAVLCVVSPQATSLGGDLFALVKVGATERVFAINSSGGAPRRATIDAYRQMGYVRIPLTGPLAVQPPGLVAGWQALADRWGSRTLGELLEPAIGFAGDGVVVGRRLARLIEQNRENFVESAGWNALFVPNGHVLREGDRLVQPALAETLEVIGQNGASGFYRGSVARDIVNTVSEAGGLLAEEDLEKVRAEVTPALTLRYRNVGILTQPPISQGIVLLRALRLFGDAMPVPSSVEESKSWVCAAIGLRQALNERLSLLGDDGRARLIAEAMLASRADMPAMLGGLAANEGKDTTVASIIDARGNAVALIQSIYADFGSGVVASSSGVLLNNRLTAFFLDPHHPNALVPGRRTMHTLHSFMVQDERGIRWAGGSPGGDIQPQVNLQVLVRLIDLHQKPTVAVGAPRWAMTLSTNPNAIAKAPKMRVQCEVGVPDETVRSFESAGFETARGPQIQLGSSKLVGYESATGTVGAWVDRRREGFVASA